MNLACDIRSLQTARKFSYLTDQSGIVFSRTNRQRAVILLTLLDVACEIISHTFKNRGPRADDDSGHTRSPEISHRPDIAVIALFHARTRNSSRYVKRGNEIPKLGVISARALDIGCGA